MRSFSENNTDGFTRRDVLKLAGLGAAAMAFPGLARNAGAASMANAKQEVIETDILYYFSKKVQIVRQ